MTEGEKLADELGNAICNNDSIASAVAAANMVGAALDKLERIAVALERLAGCVDRFDGTHFQIKSH